MFRLILTLCDFCFFCGARFDGFNYRVAFFERIFHGLSNRKFLDAGSSTRSYKFEQWATWQRSLDRRGMVPRGFTTRRSCQTLGNRGRFFGSRNNEERRVSNCSFGLLGWTQTFHRANHVGSKFSEHRQLLRPIFLSQASEKASKKVDERFFFDGFDIWREKIEVTLIFLEIGPSE